MYNQAEKYIDDLFQSNLFEGLTAFEIEEFLNSCEYKITELKVGEVLENDIDKSIFVLAGSLGTYYNTDEGEKYFINYFEPEGNNLIVVSFHRPYRFDHISVEARKQSVVLQLETNSFIKTNPSVLLLQNIIQQNIIKIFYDMTESVVNRTTINTESYATMRLNQYLLTLKEENKSNNVKIPFTRSELADYLNIDVTTLNREIKKMQKNGKIVVSGRNVNFVE